MSDPTATIHANSSHASRNSNSFNALVTPPNTDTTTYKPIDNAINNAVNHEGYDVVPGASSSSEKSQLNAPNISLSGVNALLTPQSTGTNTYKPVDNAINSLQQNNATATVQSNDSHIVHLIDADGNISCTPQQLNKLCHSNAQTTQYTVIGIMGCQSTGKSTLLNLLFYTQFQQMQSTTGRSQTTKGVWLESVDSTKFDNKNLQHNYIIMDLEGTDSGERGEDRTTFERQTALYALALCDCVLLNIWEHDIGRYTASNYGILKTIFEVNLDIFQPNTVTCLLFVVRDHNEEETPFTTIIDKINAEIHSIWSELRKPAQFQNTKIEELFDVRYIGLPHKVYQKQAFIDSVTELRQQFIQPTHHEYLFSTAKLSGKSVPIDGFGQYVEQLWKTIKSNKALDLPNQREMLAIYRCDEISSDIIQSLQQYISSDSVTGKDTVNQKFGDQYNNIISKFLQQYKQQSEHYHQEIVQRKYTELIQQLNDIMYPLYKLQINQLFKQLSAEFDGKLKSIVTELNNNYSTLYTQIEKLRSELSNTAQEYLQQYNINALTFDQTVLLHKLNTQLDDIVKQQHNALLKQLQSNTEKTLKKSTVQPINAILKQADPTLWQQLADLYRTTEQSTVNDIKQKLVDLHSNDIEINSMQHAIQSQLYDIFRNAVEQYIQLLLLHMRNQFDTEFRYDKDGVLRHWKPHDNIREVFFKCKNHALQQIELYQYWKLDRILHSNDAKSNTDNKDDTTTDTGDMEDTEYTAEEILLPDTKRTELTLQFTHDIEGALRDAELEQERTLQQLKVPVWAIVAMLFLGFNEFMTILRNPLLLILLLLIGGGLYVAYTLNILMPAYNVAKATAKQLLHQSFVLLNQYVDTNQLQQNLQNRVHTMNEQPIMQTVEFTDIRTAGSSSTNDSSSTTETKRRPKIPQYQTL